MRYLAWALAALAPLALSAQIPGNGSLSGRYGFVHLSVDVLPSGIADNARNLGGVLVFDGAGGYTFQGKLGERNNAPTAANGAGTYLVASNGFVELDGPLAGTPRLNARLGAGAAMLVGSSTAGPGELHGILVAVRLPDSGASAATLSGVYTGAAFWLPDGKDVAAKTALVSMTPNGQGAFTALAAEGHAVEANDVPVRETVGGATYSVGANGVGTLSLGAQSALFRGGKDLFVGDGGAFLVGHSTEPGGRDIFVAVRNAPAGANDAAFSGDYWMIDLFADRGASRYTAAAGGLIAKGSGTATIAQRVKSGSIFEDFSGVNAYGISSDATGFLRGLPEEGLRNFALGAAGFVGAEVFQTRPFYDIHGLTVGVRMPEISGPGVFLSPLGVLNAASFAPPTHPISGGTLLSLFGTGLAGQTVRAENIPLPTQLAGVSVTVNGTPAPLFFVSPNQINVQTPFGVQGSTATVVVTNGGQASNPVEVPVAATSPGVFSAPQTGFGPGIVTHADFQLVTEQNPARPNEALIVFLTGLGAVNPPFADGAAGPTNPLSVTTDPAVAVLFDGRPVQPFFSGAAPGFVGLYQINVRVPSDAFSGPNALAIQTSNAFSDFVDVFVVR